MQATAMTHTTTVKPRVAGMPETVFYQFAQKMQRKSVEITLSCPIGFS
jgi:hypothetical protein